MFHPTHSLGKNFPPAQTAAFVFITWGQKFELPKVDNHLNIFYAITLLSLWISQT